MEVFDRCILIRDYKLPEGTILKAGVIGTYRQKLDSIILAQFDDDNTSHMVGIPDLILRKVDNEKQLKNVRYDLITPNIYHIGNYWSINEDYDDTGEPKFKDGRIVAYKLKLNELYDIITIQFRDNIIKDYERRYIDNFGSYTMVLEQYKH